MISLFAVSVLWFDDDDYLSHWLAHHGTKHRGHFCLLGFHHWLVTSGRCKRAWVDFRYPRYLWKRWWLIALLASLYSSSQPTNRRSAFVLNVFVRRFIEGNP